MVRRGGLIGSQFVSKWLIVIFIILLGILSVPLKAETGTAGAKVSKVTVLARAKIRKGVEVRSGNFVEAKDSGDLKSPDISIHDCDFEARRVIKNCVLMIYENQ